MATNRLSTRSPRSRRGDPARRIPTMSERQWDAYIETRETLRRLRSALDSGQPAKQVSSSKASTS